MSKLIRIQNTVYLSKHIEYIRHIDYTIYVHLLHNTKSCEHKFDLIGSAGYTFDHIIKEWKEAECQ